MRGKDVATAVGAASGHVVDTHAGHIGHMHQRSGLAQVLPQDDAAGMRQHRATGVDRDAAEVIRFGVAGTHVYFLRLIAH
ncbi:hypothetical protein D3C76_1575980 [compost metagenome]